MIQRLMKYCTALLAILLMTAGTLCAQNINVDRNTGLVTVNGNEYCYIVPTSKGVVHQFNVQNLQHQDLIFVSENEGRQYNRETQTFEGDDYRVVFLGTHNWCTANSSGIGLSNYQKITRMLLQARILQNDSVVPESERLFIRNNRGIFVTKIEAGTVPKAGAPQADRGKAGKPAPVVADYLKEDRYYRNDKLVGSFTRSNGQTEVLQFFGSDDVKVATAVRNGDEWDITTTSDGRKVTLRYYSSNTVGRLFDYLLTKGYLK
jgi:hypothetical protein